MLQTFSFACALSESMELKKSGKNYFGRVHLLRNERIFLVN
jgi:hypothetical protein